MSKSKELFLKADELAEMITYLNECRDALAEVYKQVPEGIEPYLWARVKILVGEDGE